MNQTLFDYIVKMTTEIFNEVAIMQKVKTRTSNSENLFGARIKTSSNVAEVGIILEEDTISFRLSSGHCSFTEDYSKCFKTQEEFDEELPKIKSYVEDCFNKLRLRKKI